MLLKHLYNLGDERLPEYWVRDVCFRYFSVSVFFEHKFPFDPSDFVHSRDRIGEEGMEKIFASGVKIHGKEAAKESKLVLSDTTVQQNNTTFPTHAKSSKKVTDQCNMIAEKEEIEKRFVTRGNANHCFGIRATGHTQASQKSEEDILINPLLAASA